MIDSLVQAAALVLGAFVLSSAFLRRLAELCSQAPWSFRLGHGWAILSTLPGLAAGLVLQLTRLIPGFESLLTSLDPLTACLRSGLEAVLLLSALAVLPHGIPLAAMPPPTEPKRAKKNQSIQGKLATVPWVPYPASAAFRGMASGLTLGLASSFFVLPQEWLVLGLATGAGLLNLAATGALVGWALSQKELASPRGLAGGLLWGTLVRWLFLTMLGQEFPWPFLADLLALMGMLVAWRFIGDIRTVHRPSRKGRCKNGDCAD